MTRIVRSGPIAPVAASLALAVLLAGCAGDDGPAAPGGGAAQALTVDTAALAPGETRVVIVRFRPTAEGAKPRDAVEIGAGGISVALAGFGSAPPRYTFAPTGLSEGTVSTNDAGFAGDKVAVAYGTGRSHGATEDWLRCSPIARWIFNGNGISEGKVGFTFGAPAQTRRIDVLVGLEAGSDCVQFLIETDGTEHRYENLDSCQGSARSFDLAGGATPSRWAPTSTLVRGRSARASRHDHLRRRRGRGG